MMIIGILTASSATKCWINLTVSLCHITWGKDKQEHSASTVGFLVNRPAAATVVPSLQL